MKDLLKAFLIIASVFGLTFLLIKFSGLLSVEEITTYLDQSQDLSIIFIGSIITLILFADLFIAVPTLTVTILAGYFLGHFYGALFALLGVSLAGVIGYIISHYFGEKLLNLMIPNKLKQEESMKIFKKHGFVMILLSRAMPIVPETTAVLSGISKMPFLKFLSAWMISSIPYVLIATYAGSISSINDPKPAIFTAIAMSSFLWMGWYFFHKRVKYQDT